MAPVVTRRWITEPGRIGVEWRIFGFPVFGFNYLPWEMPPSQPWSEPDEYVEELQRMEAKHG